MGRDEEDGIVSVNLPRLLVTDRVDKRTSRELICIETRKE